MAQSPGAGCQPYLDPHSPRHLQNLQTNPHHAAGLVGSRWTLQPHRPPTICATRRQTATRRGRVRSRQRRSGPLRGSRHGAALVAATAGKSAFVPDREMALATHPVCLGLEGGQPYSDPGDKLDMTGQPRYRWRKRIPLLTYLKQHGWKPTAYSEADGVCGGCPLHRDSRPSFYVNRRKDVFYCHGCGQGGDVIRLAELLHGLSFRAALATL